MKSTSAINAISRLLFIILLLVGLLGGTGILGDVMRGMRHGPQSARS